MQARSRLPTKLASKFLNPRSLSSAELSLFSRTLDSQSQCNPTNRFSNHRSSDLPATNMSYPLLPGIPLHPRHPSRAPDTPRFSRGWVEIGVGLRGFRVFRSLDHPDLPVSYPPGTPIRILKDLPESIPAYPKCDPTGFQVAAGSQQLACQRPLNYAFSSLDRKSTRLNSSHIPLSRMPSSV